MGWDAYATKDGKILELSQMGDEPGDGLILTDTDLRLAFTDIADKIAKACGTVDGYLRLGGLDCSPCGVAIDKYGGVDPWSETRTSLTPENVAVIVRDWKAPHGPGQYYNWAVMSAYYFMKTCADHGLGVHFSW